MITMFPIFNNQREISIVHMTYRLRVFLVVCFLLSVHDSVYPVAIDARALKHGRSEAVDFIDERGGSDILHNEQERSKLVYEDALSYCSD